MKRRKLSRAARYLEELAIRIEGFADSVQGKIPTRAMVQMREAVRSIDDAAYCLDEKAARK